MPPRVAVIGGGALGLMALKIFKEDGFNVTLYERRAWVGGIWRASGDDSLSAVSTTTFNSSKYRSAISDFPMPDDMDDFPTAAQLHRYFESYCDHFDLWPHIELDCAVHAVTRVGDRWALEVSSTGSARQVRYFDKVAFSCGPFVKPRKPDIKGARAFQGSSLHSIDYHNPAKFSKQNVLVVGLRATAQDIIASLKGHTSKIYVSHRSGVLMIPRYTVDGAVYDRSL